MSEIGPLKRIYEWWKLCPCGVWEKGETEYIGLSFWYCTKCGKLVEKVGFTIKQVSDGE